MLIISHITTKLVKLFIVHVTDSVEVVLSRQNAVKCLLSAMRQYPKKTELLFQACKALMRQAQLSGK